MKKLLIELVLFIAPIVVLAFVLDSAVTKGMKKSQLGPVRVWDQIIEGRMNDKVVIYGSSRAVHHIDPSILQDSLHANTYNLGIIGHNFLMTKCRHDVLIKYNKAPELIILSLDIFTLDKRKDLYEYKDYLPFLNEPIISNVTKQYEGLTAYDYNLPMVRYLGHNKEIKASLKFLFDGVQPKDTVYNKGYYPLVEGWNGDFDKELAANKKYNVHIDSPTLLAFDAFLKDCSAKKINIVFVYSPEYYQRRLLMEGQNKVFDLFHSYANRYAIPFLDYSSDSMCQDKRYFHNALHLNISGANLFSKKLAHDIKTLHLLNNQK